MLAARALVAGGVLAAMLGACATSPLGTTASPSTTPNIATTKAADLRTHIDVLLAEHVMIVAKESAAALNHADDYAAYAALLNANSGDLATLFARAIGATAADELRDSWDTQNGFLVQYAIGAATHDAARSTAAASSMNTTFVPQFAQLLGTETGLPSDTISGLTTEQLTMERAFIDDYAGGRFGAFYVGIDRAYVHASLLGNAIAAQIASRFADKFPGDPEAPKVTTRVNFSVLLQEDAYLATMASAAKIASRASETASATNALVASTAALRTAFAKAMGDDAGTRFSGLWSMRNDALGRYAARDRTASSVITTTFVAGFATLSHANAAVVTNQATATMKVIDDQLAKSNDVIANDDRAAATAMEPIADAIVA